MRIWLPIAILLLSSNNHIPNLKKEKIYIWLYVDWLNFIGFEPPTSVCFLHDKITPARILSDYFIFLF